MNSQQTFRILFWLNKSKAKDIRLPIYARVTVNGRRAEISLARYCDPEAWDDRAHRIKGRNPEATVLNNYLDAKYAKLLQCYEDLLKEDCIITAQAIKSRFLGSDATFKTLNNVIEHHKSTMGDFLKHGTLKNYGATEKYLLKYLAREHKTKDIYLKNISYQFVTGFDKFLRRQKDKTGKKQLSNNGIMKHMERFKKLINLSIKLEWMEKDPFRDYKMKFEKFDRAYLNQRELNFIEETRFTRTTLEKTKDIFLFACYTGLSYIDVKNLTRENIINGVNGKDWIYCRREKSQTPIKIPLLEKAKMILEKYKTPVNEVLLPVYSNQKTNNYLKEIASQCKIPKKLSFHVARHTFATTITLSNGVPIETVSKLLGHSKLSTTQIYARVVDQKIGDDMDLLQSKLV
ncbi:site-specific integrase [Antarcticibacterium flavum]|uniref:Site-specific integrase n=1 Tax=Antarcticibacterium flavum TaxID=2058175 RepID=A0A5B7WXZ8_9FLAO|nr:MULTISPECIES: site-specific integrase [Antarcticibacterium]MCM4161687.1 integrase [Antarcticibacterium sp. W02-3]QCY68026.1 site-specific integrase [Antarcticibacterium flavum]